MNQSLGEYRALVSKAFRGAGYHWGLTEEAAHAASLLVEFGLPSGAIVVRLLESLDGAAPESLMPDHEWRSTGDRLCPVCVGTSIADSGRCESLTVGPVVEPVLIAPFLLSLLRPGDGTGFRVAWPGGHCDVAVGSIHVSGQQAEEPVTVTIERRARTIAEAGTVARAARSRADLEPDDVAALERFAHRVYAPATEESRRAGAGGDL